MTNITKTFKVLALVAIFASFSFAQTALSTTTLGAAITTTNQTNITLASTSTMQGIGLQNQFNTCIYAAKEVFGVVTVVDSTHVTVAKRGGGACGAIGASARPTFHANGEKVYFANTNSALGVSGLASTLIGVNFQAISENYGSCTATNEVSLPRIYLFTGDIFDCRNGSSGGQWIKISEGTMAPAGQNISAFCTGALTSGGTDYIGNNICATTTELVKQVITAPGTLANLYIVAGTAVTGGSAKDVLTLRVNGSDTALTCTFATGGAAVSCSDTSHSVAVKVGDTVSFKFVTASSDAGTDLSVRVGLY